jgi:hypothetical protein
MPWEVGFFDGLDQGEIGILPVLDDPDEEFEGMEFLGLYALADFRPTRPGFSALFIQRDNGEALRLKSLIRERNRLG